VIACERSFRRENGRKTEQVASRNSEDSLWLSCPGATWSMEFSMEVLVVSAVNHLMALDRSVDSYELACPGLLRTPSSRLEALTSSN